MAIHDRQGYPGKGRVKRIYDRLASILRHLTPARRAALGEYLDAEETTTKDDDGRPIEKSDSQERQRDSC